jgi:hypothetical protein
MTTLTTNENRTPLRIVAAIMAISALASKEHAIPFSG